MFCLHAHAHRAPKYLTPPSRTHPTCSHGGTHCFAQGGSRLFRGAGHVRHPQVARRSGVRGHLVRRSLIFNAFRTSSGVAPWHETPGVVCARLIYNLASRLRCCPPCSRCRWIGTGPFGVCSVRKLAVHTNTFSHAWHGHLLVGAPQNRRDEQQCLRGSSLSQVNRSSIVALTDRSTIA